MRRARSHGSLGGREKSPGHPVVRAGFFASFMSRRRGRLIGRPEAGDARARANPLPIRRGRSMPPQGGGGFGRLRTYRSVVYMDEEAKVSEQSIRGL